MDRNATDLNATDWDVVVVGAGAAGLLAACRAAERGRRTLLLEKNRKPGVKILMSGGTRCNLTHATDARGIVEAFGSQGRFLHSSLAALGPDQLVQLFRDEGLATKVEATGKVFPASDRALDVLQALLRRLSRSGAELSLAEPVVGLRQGPGGQTPGGQGPGGQGPGGQGPGGQAQAAGFQVLTTRRQLTARKLILTTGGQSYPGCGTTGDAYAWLRELGHTIVAPHPALVPLKSDSAWVRDLQGVTVPDVLVRLRDDQRPGKPLAERRGSFLFTHFGLSGPAVMDVSRAATGPGAPASVSLCCDFLPDWSEQQLSEQLTPAAGGRAVRAQVAQWLPRRLAESLADLAGLPADRKLAELSRGERQHLVKAVKRASVPIRGSLGFKKAEVTAGGVALAEVDSRTLQSKRIPALFLAGEILDLDGPIGGYNFQAAFSTGWLAGTHA